MSRLRRPQLPLSAIALLVLAGLALPPAASSLTVPPVTHPVTGLGQIPKLAKAEYRKQVAERKSDNVPRYHRGKGKVAPYSIGDAWCAAFSTWIWNKAGFDDYLGTSLLWESHDGTEVAVQVKDLTRWAQRNGYFSYRAKPGYLVAYGRSHIGVVLKADRDGRAVMSIEGNQSDQVSKVQIDMANVTGYISPVRLMAGQYVSRRSIHADID